MTSEDIRSELQRTPFVPFRLHLVSGYTIEVTSAAAASMLQNAILILHTPPREGYNLVALRNIERLEQLYPGE
jgi:hypothetical protein